MLIISFLSDSFSGKSPKFSKAAPSAPFSGASRRKSCNRPPLGQNRATQPPSGLSRKVDPPRKPARTSLIQISRTKNSNIKNEELNIKKEEFSHQVYYFSYCYCIIVTKCNPELRNKFSLFNHLSANEFSMVSFSVPTKICHFFCFTCH